MTNENYEVIYDHNIGRVYFLQKLQKEFGENATLSEVKEKILKNCKFKCPSCDGKGFERDFYHFDKMCTLCNGLGYTDVGYKPRMIQYGWEQK